ncbi:MAG: universal stress protein [Peptidiphaga sp.]|jgi:universal stress protein|uniref:universal stress protein n=1 Tax=Actinomycetaceae TaxID=2049 RepID=UPI0003980350|nr:universal stress protein [Actinobaculum sp. oral taxon 183]ERH18848.1 universal stress family protein [Actinobaculum sp. oral taxon 183 str. F0552]
MSITEVPAYNRILVGTDGSLLAEPTIVRAAGLAAANGADVVIVCAYTTLSPRESASQEASAAQVATLGQVPGAATATKALEEAVAIVEQHGARVAAALLVDAEPAVALLEAAKQYEVDALVLGAIRDTSIVGRLLGNVASEVVRKAHRDVLIVRPLPGSDEPNVGEDVVVETQET